MVIAGTLILTIVISLAGVAALTATVIALPVRAGLRRLNRSAGARELVARPSGEMLRLAPLPAPVLSIDGQLAGTTPDGSLARAA